MSGLKKSPRAGQGKQRLAGLRNIFYHNTFVMIFSLCVALIYWFVLTAGNTDTNRIINDVPITVQYSAAAEADGIRVFNMSYSSADLEIAGSNLITNKLTSEDFEVTAVLNPTSTKLTGNTLQKATLPVRASKRSSISDYNVVSISPGEISVEYDRYKEATFTIDQSGIKYSADAGFYPGTPVLSAETVTISGPESSVNKISRAAVSYTLDNPLRSDASFTCPVRLFDQNNQEITDVTSLYLEMDVDTVDVGISILPRKTVQIVASTLHQPKGFSNMRISVEPATIDIAGPADVLSGISEIQLDTPIDFAELDVENKNTFTMDIPVPAGVRNVSAVGDNAVTQAVVSVNLNGFSETRITLSTEECQISNKPLGKEVEFRTQSFEVSVIGSDAQVSRLTEESFSIQMDLTNFADRSGIVEVPVTVSVAGSSSDSCWVLGKYTLSVEITDRSTLMGNAMNNNEKDRAVAAKPQE